jgi:hypothetical protein
MFYSQRKKEKESLWQRIKNDDQGWYIAGPLFIIFGLFFLWIVKKFVIG